MNTREVVRTLVVGILVAAITSPLEAQDSSTTTLKPVIVTVTRGSGRTVLGSPFAITIAEPDSSRPGQRHASIDETLALIPGVASVSRNNPAQDPRLSIRGFGARSAFGVRGIRVLRDGMPITLPDGQTPLDFISLESVGRIEVLRGAASALYGNASGGVVDLRSVTPISPMSIDARQWFGSSAMSRSVVSASGRSGESNFVGDVAYSRSDGARAQSKQRSTTGFARAATVLHGTEYSITAMALDNPLAQNPGALTIDEMRADPEMADAASVRRNARKAVDQIQIGVSALRAMKRTELSLSAFGGARTLDNPLTFAVVEVGRHTWGASGSIRARRNAGRIENSLAIGVDAQSQNDLRRNFAVCADTVRSSIPTATCPDPASDRGVVTLDQRELVSSVGVYATDDIPVGSRMTLTGGLRADRVRFHVKDRLINSSNPDDSGIRTLGAVSPVVGIVARVLPLHSLYANVSTAFETPTATELGNHEDGTAGINPNLDPQRSQTFETGAKGWIGSALRYDAALFTTRVRDELVPFDITNGNGRRYFRNAGRTRRSGTELGAEFTHGLVSLQSSYTYSNFKFVEYTSAGTDLGGNTIPGIPRHRLQSALRFGSGGSFALIENEVAGKTFADDQNTFKAPGYAVTNVRLGTAIAHSYGIGSLVFGLQNIFDRTYASSIVVNAARGKYFEPAPLRTVYVGLSVGARTMR